jgi:hypothetical protein
MHKLRSAALPAALLALLTVLTGSAAPGAAAASSPTAGRGAGGRGDGHFWRVTLVTGDVVGVRTVPGRPPLVSVTPGPGRQHVIFTKFVDRRGQVVVIPQDVAPLLGRVLDPALFDVTTLIRDGDTDASPAGLALIVQDGHGARVAVHQSRAGAARMGARLARMAWALTSRGARAARATANIRHIWLDGPARPAGPRRSAPAARATIRRTTYRLTVHATPLPGTAAGKMFASAAIVNVDNPALYNQGVTLGSSRSATVRVPAGHYWVVGEVDDQTSATAARSALTGQPQVTVHGPTSVTLNGAAAVPVTASVTGHPTQIVEDSVHVERVFDNQVASFDVLGFGPGELFAQPSGTAATGTFRAFTFLHLGSPATTTHPYNYDLWNPVGDRIPGSLADTVTPAQQARLARDSVRFYALNGNRAQVEDVRYGLDRAGFLAAQADSKEPGGSTRTDYLSTGAGIRWDQEAVPPLRIKGQDDQGDWVIEVPRFAASRPGSALTASWIKQPFAPGPYSATVPSPSFCAPHASTRTVNDVHVELTDLQDLPDGFDCLTGLGPLDGVTSRTMRLYTGTRLLGTSHSQVADFPVPAATRRFRLSYADNYARVLPVSTRTATTWTFRAAPAGTSSVVLPLLLVRYQLPLNLDNRQDGNTAVVTAARIAGAPASRVTSLRAWISVTQGRVWRAVSARALGRGRYSISLPTASAGQSVSLRVQASDAGGSGVEQTIITAYRG